MAKEPKKRLIRKRKKQEESSGFIPVLFVGLAVLAIFKLEVAMFVAAGLIPTIVLALTGKGHNKSEKLQCVTFTNLTGIVPMIGDVWDAPNSFSTLLANPINMLIMWGAAALGYALIYVGPQIASMVLQNMSQDRIKKIMAEKQALVELWGHEVLGDKEDTSQSNFIKPRPGAQR